MRNFRGTMIGWVLKAFVVLHIVLLVAPMALSGEPSLLGSEIPLMEGARIIKEKQFQGSGRFELEVDIPPADAVKFYHAAMQDKGWPAGRVMSVGTNCALMLMHQGDMFTVKAVVKDGLTLVTLAMVRKSTVEAALKAQPATRSDNTTTHAVAQKDKMLSQNSGVTIEGAPSDKGAFIHRNQYVAGQGSTMEKKDGGNLPDDPSPQPEEPEAEDQSTEDSADAHSDDGLDVRDGIPDLLSVSVRVTTRWHVTQPEYDEYKGSITLQFNGTLKSDAAGSPSAHKGNRVLQPILTYKPEVMTLSYTYDERRTTLKPIPDGKCLDPLIVEYQDSGVSSISDGAGFKIQHFTGMAAPYLQNLSADKQQFLSAMQGSMAVPDYYELFLGGPGLKKRIPGRKKDDTKEACEYIEVDKNMSGCQVGIQMKLPASGGMYGSRTWSADDQGMCPPSLGIHVSDIAEILKKPPLRPSAGGNKNVTYTVSWQIQKGEEYSPIPAESTDKEKPCEILLNRINTIRINRKLFQNKKLQRYCEEKFGKQDYKSYNDILEKAASYVYNQEFETYQEASDFIDNLDPNQIQSIASSDTGEPTTYMKTDVLYTTSDNKVVAVKLIGYLNGKPVPIMEFPDGDVGSARKNGYYDQVRNAYDRDYYQSGAGRSMFDSQVKHEMTHARQYLEKGYLPESINEFSEWEQEAYKNELDELIQDFKDAGC